MCKLIESGESRSSAIPRNWGAGSRAGADGGVTEPKEDIQDMIEMFIDCHVAVFVHLLS